MATELGHGVGLKSPRSPMGDFNLVRAAVKLNRRGEGFAKLFQPNVLAGDSEDDPVSHAHSVSQPSFAICQRRVLGLQQYEALLVAAVRGPSSGR